MKWFSIFEIVIVLCCGGCRTESPSNSGKSLVCSVIAIRDDASSNRVVCLVSIVNQSEHLIEVGGFDCTLYWREVDRRQAGHLSGMRSIAIGGRPFNVPVPLWPGDRIWSQIIASDYSRPTVSEIIVTAECKATTLNSYPKDVSDRCWRGTLTVTTCALKMSELKRNQVLWQTFSDIDPDVWMFDLKNNADPEKNSEDKG